ncbi:MAG: NAD(+) synthase [Bacillales bacterium]|nr:NAD(+) synthase [Bacillales bacterium]
MSKIIPITDLRKTQEISTLCHKNDKPIFVTKNGYNDLVIMSNEVYERIEGYNQLENRKTKAKEAFEVAPQDDCMGFIKVAAANFDVEIHSITKNCESIIKVAKEAFFNGAKIIVFPELCITSYTSGDMFYQKTLLEKAERGIQKVCDGTKEIDAFIVVGAPLYKDGKLFNCGIALHKGSILGVVPKSFVPNYNEFYEKRYFSEPIKGNSTITILDKEYPFGTKLLFKNVYCTDEIIGIEICEDVWMGIPPSSYHSLAGATIECNLSASNETLHKDKKRRDLVKNQAWKNNIGYIYSSSSYYESTSDVIYSSHNIIAEPDGIIAESSLFESNITYGEIDLDRIILSKIQNNSVGDTHKEDFEVIPFKCHLDVPSLTRTYKKLPFIDENKYKSTLSVQKTITMQGYALARRLKHIHCSNVVIGLSGGLDSTIALIACVKAFEILGYDSHQIHAITMPCFGTSVRTKQNAIKLADYYKVTLKEINISDSVKQHLNDISHSLDDHSVTFENAQARERTQVLMDYANKVNGIVIGTGDLSEIALGWSTYNGDHMSMYAVNCSLTKTYIREMTRIIAELNPQIKDTLLDILGTPISPELIPPKEGEITQLTEDLVGPYELHDFFLYHFVYQHMSVRKLYYVAKATFKKDYKEETIHKWLNTFIKRFFNNQFKRSCIPDGPKISEVSLSPRGDLRLPSDGSYATFIEDL